MTLSDFVINYRKEHGVSQRQFALACDVSNGYISMLERGENPKTGLPLVPSLTALKKIAAGMNISISDLFAQVDDMPVDLTEDGNKKSAIDNDDGLTIEIIQLFAALSNEHKQEALNYLRYLSKSEDNP